MIYLGHVDFSTATKKTTAVVIEERKTEEKKIMGRFPQTTLRDTYEYTNSSALCQKSRVVFVKKTISYHVTPGPEMKSSSLDCLPV